MLTLNVKSRCGAREINEHGSGLCDHGSVPRPGELVIALAHPYQQSVQIVLDDSAKQMTRADANLDRINQRTYRRRGVIRQFATASGWLEPGERLAIEHVAAAARGGAILDIGIGGGRTSPLMAGISANYRGIDYCPDMVEVARARFPTLSLEAMDARKLAFADGSFQLAAFSYNGIDSVDLTGRIEILRQVHRVLCPGGYFVFSALNRQGSAYGERWPDWSVFRHVSWSPARLARAVARFALGGLNRARYHFAAKPGVEIATGTLSAHNFGLVTLFTSLDVQLRQLAECGFVVEAIFEPSGRRVAADGTEKTGAPWYHFVARKSSETRP